MCRWLAYSGSPVLIEEFLLKPKHSLVDQSLHSRLGAETTNGDGFGLGWYGVGDTPGVFRSVEPAWNDRNLKDLARHLRSPLAFAHIRAATGGPIQQSNCHPFRHRNWLWMHNGLIREFATVKRDLVLAVDPSLYPEIEGSTDSEVFFYLALTLGLEDDPPKAVERAVGFIEETGRRHGVEQPIQMTVATTNGSSVWAFRYSSEGASRSLFYSTAAETLRAQYPDNPVLHELSDETRLIVSEPLGDLAGVWNEVPESSYCVIQQGQDELRPFTPRSAPAAASVRPRSALGGLGVDRFELVCVIRVPDTGVWAPSGGVPSLANGPNEILTQRPPASAPGAAIVPRHVCAGLERLRQRRRVARRGAEPRDVAVAASPLEILQVVVREEQHAERAVGRETRVADRPRDLRRVLDRDLGSPSVARHGELRNAEDESRASCSGSAPASRGAPSAGAP